MFNTATPAANCQASRIVPVKTGFRGCWRVPPGLVSGDLHIPNIDGERKTEDMVLKIVSVPPEIHNPFRKSARLYPQIHLASEPEPLGPGLSLFVFAVCAGLEVHQTEPNAQSGKISGGPANLERQHSMTPEDIEELFKRTEGVVLPEDRDEDEVTLTDEEKSYRIDQLRGVLLEAQNAWASGSDDLDRIAEKLGDGSRKEPVQLQASEAGLSQWLIEILGGPRLEASRPYINLIGKILALLITQEPEFRNGAPAAPLILLSVATNQQHPVDLEDFSSLAAVALAYLTHETFQTYSLADLPLFLTAFSTAYTRFDPAEAEDPDDAAQLTQVRNAFVPVLADISALPGFVPNSDQGGTGLLQHPVPQTLQSWLHGPPEHANMQTAACLALGNLARSDATCIILVRDAAVHQPLVNLLARCTSGETTPNAQLTHAVLSFLKNLAIPAVNKPALGRLLDPDLLPRLWSTWGDAQPQTQFVAVSLARLLLVGCPANVKRLLASPSGSESDSDSKPHDERSKLQLLTALFDRSDSEPTKTEVARAVATVCRILHSMPVGEVLPEESIPGSETAPSIATTTTAASNSNPDPNIDNTSTSPAADNNNPTPTNPRARFYAAHPNLSIPLSFLISQTRFPALRSEAWFVLALMSRSPDGAALVQATLQSFEACRALVESVTGQGAVAAVGRNDDDDLKLLLAASGSPAADGQEVVAGISEGDGNSGGGGGESTAVTSTTATSATTATTTSASLGIEGLGLGGLEPQAVDPALQANMARVDRENGLCLVAELMRGQASDGVSPLRRNVYEQLLLTGGELVLHSRAQADTQ
ncbi:hypothetical protein SLS53_001686 [Cytospora paraplurivora]|uniref:GTP binding protein n=1 Tax=Cytospora paraplurivora TaxID=2898453 RepID=A0AAN9UGI3_9PEZI